jgi:hypothetical protein
MVDCTSSDGLFVDCTVFNEELLMETDVSIEALPLYAGRGLGRECLTEVVVETLRGSEAVLAPLGVNDEIEISGAKLHCGTTVVPEGIGSTNISVRRTVKKDPRLVPNLE